MDGGIIAAEGGWRLEQILHWMNRHLQTHDFIVPTSHTGAVGWKVWGLYMYDELRY